MQTDTAPDATPARPLLAEELAAITSALERVRSTLGSWQTRLARNTGIFAP
jgi:hypothetical protein